MEPCTRVDANWTLRRGEDTTATWELLTTTRQGTAPYVAGEIIELAFGEWGTTGAQVFKLSTETPGEGLAVVGSPLVLFNISGEQADLLLNDTHQADVWRITSGRRKCVGVIEVTVLPRVNDAPGV